MSQSEVPSARLSPAQAFAAPLSLIVGIVLLGLLGPVRAQPALFRSFVGVGILLAIWAGVLLSHARLRNRVLVKGGARLDHRGGGKLDHPAVEWRG